MILLVLTALTAVCGAAKLDRTYLPPASAKTAGGSPGSLQTPLTGSFNQGIGELPAGGYTNDAQGVVVDAALTGTRSTGESEQSGLGGPRPSYGSTASKVGDAAFRGSQNNFGAPLNDQINGAFEAKPERPQATQDRNSNIITYENNVDINNYNYGFETDNGIAVGENGVAHDGVHAQGGYSYKGDDGQVYSVTYTADKNGYKPQGSHLPTAPPIPDEILKSIEQNKKDEAAGLVDDGSYDAQKYNAEGDYTESDSNKYNGEQQSQFDKRPGSDTTSNGAVINQNGLNSGPANGAQTQNDVPTIIPGLSSQTFTGQPLPGFGQLAQIGSQFISKPGGQNGFDSLTGSAIEFALQHGWQSLKPQLGQSSIIPSTFPSLLPNQGSSLLSGSTSQTNIGNAIIGSLTQFDEAQGTTSTGTNQQSSPNDEQPIAQNSLTYTGTSSKPGIQQFGSNYKPTGTTTNNFGQAGQSGFINNEYLPPFSDAGQTQLNYNAQPQKPGAFTFSTNKPFGSIGGFPTPSGSPPGQFTSSTLNSQSSYGNQQQVSGSIEPVSRPGLLQSTSPQGSTETASNNFGSFKPQNSVPQAGLTTSMKQNEEKPEGDAGAQGQISNNPSQPSTSTTTGQIGTSQFPSQAGQNSHVAGFQSFKPTFGSYNTQKQPSAFPVQQPQGQGQINELLTSSNRPSSFQTGFTQNDAFGTQSSPASVHQFQGQRPFSGNQQPSYTQNVFSTQPQIPTIPSQQLSQPLSGGQPPQSFQNGFNQNNGLNTKPSRTPGKQPQGQISQPGLINKPQPLQTGLSQNGAFASQNKPLSSSNLQPQGQNQFGQASIGNKPQTFQNGFTQTGAFGINKPTNPTLVQNQQNQFSSGQKQPSPFQTGFSQNNNLFGKPTASSGPIQNAFGSQRPQTQSTTSPFNNQPIVVQQPQRADHSYYYNQPTKPFSTPSSEIQQGGKVPFSSKPSNIPTVDKIKYPSTEDQEEYANSTSKPEQQPGASQPVFNGVTQASASPFPTKPTIPSAQFGNTFGVKPQQVLTPQKPQTFLQSGQQFSKPESVQSTIQNVNNQYKPQKGVSQDEPAKTDSEDNFNPSESKPTQQYDGELYQYNKPEPVLAPGTEQEDSSDDKSSNEQPQTKPQFDQDSQSPSKTETEIQTSSFEATKPTNQFSFGITPQQPTSQSQFGSQPFKPFGAASLPGSLPAKGQFGQNSQSSFTNIPTSQLAGFQFGTPPLKPFGQQPTGAFGSNLKPQFGQTQQTKPQFDQSLNVSPQTSQSSQPGFGSPVIGTQGFPTQFGNQGYKPFGVAQTPTKPQFGFPSNAQAGQIQSPNYNQQSISKFGFQTYKPFGSQIPANIPQIGQSQPIFGSNQAQPARGQYNDYQTQFPASTKPEFGQSSANAYASSSPVVSNSQAFRQPNKPFGFQPASSPSSYSQRPSQESEASSSATAQGPSATASAQASTGQESEVQAKPAFGKPCCKIAQFGQTSNQDAQNQETKGEEFSGPKQPQRFDEKTGYHY